MTPSKPSIPLQFNTRHAPCPMRSAQIRPSRYNSPRALPATPCALRHALCTPPKPSIPLQFTEPIARDECSDSRRKHVLQNHPPRPEGLATSPYPERVRNALSRSSLRGRGEDARKLLQKHRFHFVKRHCPKPSLRLASQAKDFLEDTGRAKWNGFVVRKYVGEGVTPSLLCRTPSGLRTEALPPLAATVTASGQVEISYIESLNVPNGTCQHPGWMAESLVSNEL